MRNPSFLPNPPPFCHSLHSSMHPLKKGSSVLTEPIISRGQIQAKRNFKIKYFLQKLFHYQQHVLVLAIYQKKNSQSKTLYILKHCFLKIALLLQQIVSFVNILFVLCICMPFLVKESLSKEQKLKTITSAITNFGDSSPGTNVHAYAYFYHILRQMPLH